MAAGCQLGAFRHADLHVALDGLELLPGDQGAHLVAFIQAGADLDGQRAADQLADEAVVDRTLYEQTRAGRAHFAAAGEDADESAVDSGLEVGVGEDDVRALAAQLEAHLLHVLGALAHDVLADLHAAREGHHVYIRRRGEVVAYLSAGTGDHLHHASRQAHVIEDPRHLQAGERRYAGRLEDHHVAGGQRRSELPGRHEHGEVPGRDAGGDAYRLAHDHAQAVARHLQRLTVLLHGEPSIVIEGVGGVVHVDQRVRQRLAHLARLQDGQLLGALADLVGYLAQNSGPLYGRRARPRSLVERLASGAYGALGVGATAPRYGSHDLFGRRVDNLVGHSVVGVDPFAVDEHAVVLHRSGCSDGSHLAQPPHTRPQAGSCDS